MSSLIISTRLVLLILEYKNTVYKLFYHADYESHWCACTLCLSATVLSHIRSQISEEGFPFHMGDTPSPCLLWAQTQIYPHHSLNPSLYGSQNNDVISPKEISQSELVMSGCDSTWQFMLFVQL